MFEGRTKESKKELIRSLFRRFEAELHGVTGFAPFANMAGFSASQWVRTMTQSVERLAMFCGV